MKSFEQFSQSVKEKEGNYMLPSGKIINFFNMNTEDILIEDIAHSLARKCRWNGWTKGLYTIAEHSLHTAAFVPPPLKFTALLHDAPEAYLFDIPRPLKNKFPGLTILEDGLHLIITEKFRLPYPLPKEVVQADDYVLEQEYKFCYQTESIKAMDYREAEDKFLMKFYEYQKYHEPVDWVKDQVDKLKARIDEEKWMQRLADEIEPELKKEAKNGK